jgi:hypothetical protein
VAELNGTTDTLDLERTLEHSNLYRVCVLKIDSVVPIATSSRTVRAFDSKHVIYLSTLVDDTIVRVATSNVATQILITVDQIGERKQVSAISKRSPIYVYVYSTTTGTPRSEPSVTQLIKHTPVHLLLVILKRGRVSNYLETKVK